MGLGVRWGNSAVAAAVIEVLGLAIIAIVVTSRLDHKRIELQDSLEERRIAQEDDLAYRREFQSRRFEAAERLANLVNRATAHCEEMLDVSGSPWTGGEGLSPQQRARLDAQRLRVLEDFNQFTRDWRIGRGTLSLMIRDYFAKAEGEVPEGEVPVLEIELMDGWRRLEEAVDAYLQGARTVYVNGSGPDLTQLQDEVQWRLEHMSRLMLTNIPGSSLRSEQPAV